MDSGELCFLVAPEIRTVFLSNALEVGVLVFIFCSVLLPISHPLCFSGLDAAAAAVFHSVSITPAAQCPRWLMLMGTLPIC